MTKRIRFIKKHDLWLNVSQTVAYEVGHEVTLPDAKADELLAKGVAEQLDEEPKSEPKRSKKNG